MEVILIPLFQLISVVINMLVWVIIIGVVLSWLLAFGIVNPQNQFVSLVSQALFRLTEPLLRPIRQILPEMGGLDLSPLVLILLLYFIQNILGQLLIKFMT